MSEFGSRNLNSGTGDCKERGQTSLPCSTRKREPTVKGAYSVHQTRALLTTVLQRANFLSEEAISHTGLHRFCWVGLLETQA